MSQIIVSAKYFGNAILAVRRKNNITVPELTHLLGCTTNQLHRYIHGSDLIPNDVLERIIKYAIKMDKTTVDE